MRYVLNKTMLRADDRGATGSDECVFWQFTDAAARVAAGWDTEGCVQNTEADLPEGMVECVCTHLTNFAVLTSPSASLQSDAVRTSLEGITYVGAALSVPGMLVTAAVFLAYKKLRSIGRLITVHLCVNLAVATLLLVFGVDKTGDAAECTRIATALHFFLLTSFSWMMIEGVHMYKTFVVVFDTKRSDGAKHGIYAAFAYLLPGGIVIATSFISGDSG